MDAVFAFTYVVSFFNKLGFQEVERGALPLKAWKDCVRCPKFQACDEIAVIRVLRAKNCPIELGTWMRRAASNDDRLIQIPAVKQSY
jgi:amino-acid N-acetyltransferase